MRVRVRGEGEGLGLGCRLHLAHALLGGGEVPRVLGGLQLGLLPLPRLGLVQRSVRGGLQRRVRVMGQAQWVRLRLSGLGSGSGWLGLGLGLG